MSSRPFVHQWSQPKLPSSVRGFTLVELLVAITIMAVVAVLGWRGLDSIVRARVSLNRDLEQSRGLQLAFSQMQSDGARIVNAADIGGRAPVQITEDRLQMVRTVLQDNLPSQVQIVVYRLRDGELQRIESIATRDLNQLDALWQAFSEDKATVAPVTLYKDVAALRMRSWLFGANTWVGTTVSGAARGGAPVAVKGLEVTLELNAQPAPLTRVFLVGAG